MSERYFEIQYYRASDDLWCQSSSAPFLGFDSAEKQVWIAYVNYLAIAYPDTLYRLVEVTTEKKVEVIHV